MRTRMVPFQRHVQRLARIVRQAAAETGKRAELIVEGASGELDRQGARAHAAAVRAHAAQCRGARHRKTPRSAWAAASPTPDAFSSSCIVKALRSWCASATTTRGMI